MRDDVEMSREDLNDLEPVTTERLPTPGKVFVMDEAVQIEWTRFNAANENDPHVHCLEIGSMTEPRALA